MTAAGWLPSAPLPEVYVLWHPSCAVGEVAARRIYHWLRPGAGSGPRVFYRSLPDPRSPKGLPLPLPGETRGGTVTPRSDSRTNLQIVVPLIDDSMVADGGFRYWLESLRASVPAGIVRRIFPVALDATAFGAPPSIRELNFIRPTSGGPLRDHTDAQREVFLRSLTKQLTEALCRLLVGTTSATAGAISGLGGQPGGPAAQPNGAPTPASDASEALKLKVFLSHAKADGTTPARRVRDYIYSQTQLAAFYDDNDIPFGSAFARVLKREATSTVALVAIRSAKYAARPWCRREISLFRKPIRVDAPGDSRAFWRLHPTLVVTALEAGVPTTSVAEFGNAPEIRWSTEVPEQEELIVTTLLRDALLSQFHAVAAGTIPAAGVDVVLNWLPDPTTLLQVDGLRSTQTKIKVVYPGHLSKLEQNILCDLFPGLELRSFEECWS